MVHARSKTFDFKKERDLDWAQTSIVNALQLYQAGYLPLTDQTEADILKRVWPLIDMGFDGTLVDVRRSAITRYM